MSKANKILNILKSLIMALIGVMIIILPIENGYIIACSIIGFFITLSGIRNLVFYFTHAIHMVGGQKILINSIIRIDLGLLSFFVLLEKSTLAMLYLVGIFMVIGVIDLLRSFEIKKNESKMWIVKFIKGLLTIGIGILCIVYVDSADLMLLVLGISWIVSAVEGIIVCFAKSSIAYVAEFEEF